MWNKKELVLEVKINLKSQKKTDGIHSNWTGITNPVLNPDFQR